VIVGAGAGGSVLASRLSQAPFNFTVALLEAGGDPPADSDVPALQNLQVYLFSFRVPRDFLSVKMVIFILPAPFSTRQGDAGKIIRLTLVASRYCRRWA
jgi:choline dehydrogenase-like flavoprotein